MLTYLGDGVDMLSLPWWQLRSSQDPNFARVLASNEDVADRLKSYALPSRRYFEAKSASVNEPLRLNAMVLLPPGFDQRKSYPIIVNQYSGPGSQTIAKTWSLDIDAYWASKGFIVAKVDPRGTGRRGVRFMTQTYLKLGIVSSV